MTGAGCCREKPSVNVSHVLSAGSVIALRKLIKIILNKILNFFIKKFIKIPKDTQSMVDTVSRGVI
jgi:hypothetical protein